MVEPTALGTSHHAIAPAERLMSLDALRGFDMMWIVGADALGHALAHVDAGPVVKTIATQLDHVPWAGFRFYDLIFPLFVFMIGVAVTFSLGRLVERQGRSAAVVRILRRTCLLYLLGLFYYGGIGKGFDQIRWLGVLQRLALCYGFTGICFVYLSRRALAITTVVLLVGYWAMLTFIPVPGFGPGDFAEGHNLTNWIDQHYLSGFKWDGDHDPEGILSTLPAFASCLLGVFAGLHLQNQKWSGGRRAALLAGAGIVSLAVGYAWGLQFPIVKKLWTSSFVLVAGGWSALLLALFYYVIDVRGICAWAVPFTWIGTNALVIYLISNVVDFDTLSKRFAGGGVQSWFDTSLGAHSGAVVLALVGLTLCFVICRFLHNRQIFLRL
jgi:predicted acyltransferase